MASARELGIEGRVATAAEFEALDGSRLAAALADVGVIAGVSTAQQRALMRALRAQGSVICADSDEDARLPADTQSAADAARIGEAKGKRITAIVAAIAQGRALYAELVKLMRLQLATAAGACLAVLFAEIGDLPDPLSPLQLLWAALAMNAPPALALTLSSSSSAVMHDAPRSMGTSIVPLPHLASSFASGLLMAAGTLGVLYYGMLGGAETHAATLAFATFGLFQIFNVFASCGQSGASLDKHCFGNPALWSALALSAASLVAAVQLPAMHPVFHTSALHPHDWAIAVAVASSLLIANEARRLLTRIATTKTKRGE
jgi:Ca2+-transporting ATPase